MLRLPSVEPLSTAINIGLLIFAALLADLSNLSRGGVAFTLLLTALTWTQLFLAQAPSLSQLIPNWILAPLVFAAIPYFFDRKRVAAVPNIA